jgi:hypothetical protein
MIENLGKGCLPDKPDERDYQITFAAPLVDWSQEYRLPNPGDEDQGSSDSCVAQAWSYYHTQLHPKAYSRRDLFARIALSYGAEIRSGGKEIVGSGQATRDEVPDPSPQTPQNMRDKSGITPEKQADDKELNYFVISGGGIDAIAAAIKNYKGVVFGVTGTNDGWHDLTNPRPPFYGEPNQWGHALYAMGFHMHSGQKCIIAKSSWCNAVSEHHIKQNYFDSGNTFNAWTLIPKGQSMQLINDNGTVYLVAGNTDKRVTGIADQETLRALFGDELVTGGKISSSSTGTLGTGINYHNNG